MRPRTVPQSARAITEDEWDEAYGGYVPTPDGDAIWEHLPPEGQYADDQVWNVVDTDDGTLYLLRGRLDVNQVHHVGYVVSTLPYGNEDVDAIWWETEEPSVLAGQD